MKRKIKFKFWNGKKMIMPFMTTSNYINCEYYTINISPTDIPSESTETALLQFTGLKDKNGVEIYEGDVLKDVHFGYNTKVVYIGNQFVSESNVGNVGLFETENYEVIGNIFQNPDLLQSS